MIAGAGTVGLLALIASRKIGVDSIYVSGSSVFKRDTALKLRATAAFDPLATKIPKEIITSGFEVPEPDQHIKILVTPGR